jgi:hypothetical protein
MGRRPLVEPEIHDICFWKRAKYGWSGDRIAEYLFNNHGVHHPDDPDRPVHRGTIHRWAALGEEQLTAEQAHKHKVEMAVAYVELDDLKERLHDFAEQGGLADLDETVKFIETAIKIRTARNQTYALYEKVQAIVDERGLDLQGLDPETDAMLSGLERHVQEQRFARQHPVDRNSA